LEEVIKSQRKKFTEYQKFIIVDSGEDIPTGYQKIPYDFGFDIKYDLRHKAKLVT
jgi:hypothetical protein